MDVSENSGTPKLSILIGFSIIKHPFWGTPIFGNIHLGILREQPAFRVLFSFSGKLHKIFPVTSRWEPMIHVLVEVAKNTRNAMEDESNNRTSWI